MSVANPQAANPNAIRGPTDDLLARLDSHFFGLANTVEGVVWAARADGFIDYSNDQCAEILWRQIKSLSIVNWQGIVVDTEIPRISQLMKDHLLSGQSFSFACQIQSPRGLAEYILSGACMRNDAHRIVRWVGTIVDRAVQKSLAEPSPGEAKSYIMGITQCERSTIASLPPSEFAMRLASERMAKRFEFLSLAGAQLSSSLDIDLVLQRLVKLAVPRMADFIAIQKRLPNESIQTMAYAHRDPSKFQFGWVVGARHAPTYAPPFGTFHVIRTGQPQLIQDPLKTAIFGEKLGITEEAACHLRGMGQTISSAMVPLRVRDRIIGTLSFYSTSSKRIYDDDDMRFAEEFAHLLAIAIDNSKLYNELQKTNNAKDEFLATLSHELRTPLNIIRGYSELLLSDYQTMDSDSVKSALDSIHRSCLAQVQMIDDMLDMSALIMGKTTLLLEPVSVAELALNALANFRLEAESKRIVLRPNFSSDLPIAQLDARRFQQVLWNLLSNAIKYTPFDGEVSLSVRSDLEMLIVEVKDTGIGIDSQFIPYVFDRFRQEESGTSRRYGGLGLGLAIAQNIVSLHEGTIHVESAGRNLGSRFIVRLPLKLSPTHALTALPAVEPVPSNVDLRGRKILVVEDDKDTRCLTRRFLELSGAGIDEAASAREALALLNQNRYDLILSDIGMAQEDGISFIKKVRRNEEVSGGFTPAAALTAYTRADDRERILNAGFQSHICKPFSKSKLIASVARLLCNRSRFFQH